MRSIRATLYALAALGAFAAPAASMSKNDYCRNYAGMAVGSARHNIRWHCGYGGTRYSLDAGLHYSWCMSVERPASDREHEIRRREMNACKR
jgi:hypothetical protein